MFRSKNHVVKEETWQNKNVDLKKLTVKIKKFFYVDNFSEVQSFEDPSGNYIQIQARKTGILRTMTSQRKAIQVIIRGDSNNFMISLSKGDWGKNITASALFNIEASLVGMGLNELFFKKLWNFIKNTVDSLENSYQKPLSTNSQNDNPLQILQRRLALGEISKEEFDELSLVLVNNGVVKNDTFEVNEEPTSGNYARIVYDD